MESKWVFSRPQETHRPCWWQSRAGIRRVFSEKTHYTRAASSRRSRPHTLPERLEREADRHPYRDGALPRESGKLPGSHRISHRTIRRGSDNESRSREVNRERLFVKR